MMKYVSNRHSKINRFNVWTIHTHQYLRLYEEVNQIKQFARQRAWAFYDIILSRHLFDNIYW